MVRRRVAAHRRMTSAPAPEPGTLKDLVPCAVRRDAEDMRFVLSLRPLIADWRAAVPLFMAGLAERLGSLSDLVEPQASDWTVQSTDAVAARFCECRLLRGAVTITLRPHELSLSFTTVRTEAYGPVFDVLSSSFELMRTRFSDHALEVIELTSVQHAEILEKLSAEAYLGQFVHPALVQSVSEGLSVQYEPSMRTLLVGTDGKFRIQRIMERSAVRQGALFVSTHISSAGDRVAPTKEGLLSLFRDSCQIADVVVALRWE